MRLDLMNMPEVLYSMDNCVSSGRDIGSYVVVANANDAVACCKDEKARKASNSSFLTVPDGISLVILSRLLGGSLKRRVYGPDLMAGFLKLSESKGYSHFFYGATESTLRLLIDNLKLKFPSLKIAGSYAPPFRPLTKEEDGAVVDIINKTHPDVVWVGLGCPKQQIWMYEHKDKLRVPVMVGVGAAFDFLAGVKPQAPRWLRDHGFEWLFRLVTEPKRLWRRYLISYPQFAYYILVDFVKNRLRSDNIRS